jgi:hypothetical protein
MSIRLTVMTALFCSTFLIAQDRDRDRDDRRNDPPPVQTIVQPGTVMSVRLNESVDVERSDNRVFSGVVDQDVRGDNGRLALPRGSTVELIVRVSHDNDLILDVDSVVSNGQRYAVKSDPKRFESRRDDSLVGSIVGAIEGGQSQGRAVRIPRDTVVTFRLQRPLEIGVPDRGVMRDGRHYHDPDNDRNDRNR